MMFHIKRSSLSVVNSRGNIATRMNIIAKPAILTHIDYEMTQSGVFYSKLKVLLGRYSICGISNNPSLMVSVRKT